MLNFSKKLSLRVWGKSISF